MQMPDDNFTVEDLICNESFQQYCLGYSIEDQLLWEDWIGLLPHKKADFEEARRIVNILNVKQGSRSEQFQQLKTALKQKSLLRASISLKSAAETSGSEKAVIKRRTFYKYAGITAILLLIAASLYFYRYPFEKYVTDLHVSGERFSSGKALRKTILLPDGTVITLAKESAVNLQNDFNKGNRELWLTGEAFFDVKHDAAHPFIVHTAFNDIKVLGTTFNVKAYPGAKAMETVLIKGSVRVDSKKYPGYFAVLKPNQKLISSDLAAQAPAAAAKKEYRISELKPIGYLNEPKEIQWVRKRLDIDNLPLSVIAGKLQDWYGIEIEVDEAVQHYRYSGVFENETIIKTLEALQLSYPFKFKTTADKITITK